MAATIVDDLDYETHQLFAMLQCLHNEVTNDILFNHMLPLQHVTCPRPDRKYVVSPFHLM